MLTGWQWWPLPTLHLVYSVRVQHMQEVWAEVLEAAAGEDGKPATAVIIEVSFPEQAGAHRISLLPRSTRDVAARILLLSPQCVC
jgi:streptogramin lyase